MLRSPGPQVADTPDSSHARQGMQTPGDGRHLTHTGPRPGPCGHVHCPTVPRGQEWTDTWSVGGGCPSVRIPTNASDFYSFFLFLFCFCFFFISSNINCFCGCCLVVKKKSRPVLVFCRHRHQGRNEADTNMRQAGHRGAAGLQTLESVPRLGPRL